jgi:hypothetical protein
VKKAPFASRVMVAIANCGLCLAEESFPAYLFEHDPADFRISLGKNLLHAELLRMKGDARVDLNAAPQQAALMLLVREFE